MIKFLFFTLTIFQIVWAQEIKSVNFVQEGEVSKLIIEVDKPVAAERFPVTEDKQIILDLKNVKADKKTLRGLDTSEFDGAVVFVSGYQKPGAPQDVRFALQLRDNVRSLVETQGNRIVLAVENRFGVFSKARIEAAENKVIGNEKVSSETADILKINVPKSQSIEDILENLTMSGPKKYIGKKISINVKAIPIVDVLKMIADTSGFNIIIDQDVDKSPPLTLTLTNTPWDQALDTIMSISKLTASKNMNILTIKTLEQATKEAQEAAKLEASRIALEPLVTKVFPISYAEMKSLMPILQDYLTPSRGSIREDPRTNSVIVRDTVEVIDRVKKIVEVLDTQTPQVLIESKIVEAQDNFSQSIGLREGLLLGYDPFSRSAAGSGAFSFSSASMSAADVPTSRGAIGGLFSIGKLQNINFQLDLQETVGKVKVVSSPKVITQHRKEAQITATEVINVPINPTAIAGNPGTATVNIERIAAPIELKVIPTVTNEGAINLEVDVTRNTIVPQLSATAPPGVNERNIKTNVLVDNGSTVVLGGLYTTTDRENHTGIPFLKDIPLIGWLFRTPHNPSSNKTELLVFLTPRIINQEEAGLVDRESTMTESEPQATP